MCTQHQHRAPHTYELLAHVLIHSEVFLLAFGLCLSRFELFTCFFGLIFLDWRDYHGSIHRYNDQCYAHPGHLTSAQLGAGTVSEETFEGAGIRQNPNILKDCWKVHEHTCRTKWRTHICLSPWGRRATPRRCVTRWILTNARKTRDLDKWPRSQPLQRLTLLSGHLFQVQPKGITKYKQGF